MDRFWNKVDTTGDCWLWQNKRDRDGYGRISINGRAYRAHRVAWELKCGSIPPDMSVLHHCDNPACVRPSHLFLGTQRENMQDRAGKGRYHTTTDDPTTGVPKLTPEQVREIRARYVPRKVTTYQLAHDYNVSQALIVNILHGVVWKHI